MICGCSAWGGRRCASVLADPTASFAAGAVGPYSQAIKANGMVFISGQVGLVPGTKHFAGESVEAQAEQVMANLGAILAAAGSDWSKVVKTTILLVRAWVGGWLGGRVGGWGWGAALGWPGLGWVLSSAAPIGRALGLMQG
jgi:hypothetical protein